MGMERCTDIDTATGDASWQIVLLLWPRFQPARDIVLRWNAVSIIE
jgi:hypothetical protein